MSLAIAAAMIFSPGGAGAHERAPRAVIHLLPAAKIVANVRLMGLAPNTPARRRGRYYVLHAVDLRGIEQRVVADAQFGDILSITPVLPASYTPYYVRGPHIIHVPPRRKAAKKSK